MNYYAAIDHVFEDYLTALENVYNIQWEKHYAQWYDFLKHTSMCIGRLTVVLCTWWGEEVF